MLHKTSLSRIPPYVTRDGSGIRELMHPNVHGNANQSLAEATVPPQGRTYLHRHLLSEELYHFTQGQGMMTLDGENFAVTAGDTVCILAGQWHALHNTGTEDMRLLCCCSPPYSHEDTELA